MLFFIYYYLFIILVTFYMSTLTILKLYAIALIRKFTYNYKWISWVNLIILMSFLNIISYLFIILVVF